MNDKTKRYEWIDMMRGTCILLVLLHHSFAPSPIQKFLTPFFLSGFFFISGYLFVNLNKPFNPKYKFLRIIESLLIPYIIYIILSSLVKSIIGGVFFDQPLQEMGRVGITILRGDKLWFMGSIICSELMLLLLYSFNRNTKFLVVSILISLSIWWLLKVLDVNIPYWGINTAFVSYVFLSLGVLGKRYDYIFDMIAKYKYIILSLYMVLIATDVVFDYLSVCYALNQFNNLFVFIVFAIVGILMILLFFRYSIVSSRYVMFYGKNSILVYFFCNQVIMFYYKYVPVISGFESLRFIPIFFLTCLTLIIPVWLCKRYFKILAGGGKFLTHKS